MTSRIDPTVLPTPQPTPLVVVNTGWCKLEGQQITGSVKYRLVYAAVKAACEAGLIDARTVLTEVTAGSTGVALAYVGARLGLRVELHVYRNACPHKCARMRQWGASLIVHAEDAPITELLAYVTQQVIRGGYWHVNQYQRHTALHAYQALGDEVMQQLADHGGALPHMFACPVGTGGLIQGVGARLRQTCPALQIVAVEPAPDVTIDGMRNTDTYYLGDNDPYNRDFPDMRLTVRTPVRPARAEQWSLGLSATAVYEMVQHQGWQGVLIVAPD